MNVNVTEPVLTEGTGGKVRQGYRPHQHGQGCDGLGWVQGRYLPGKDTPGTTYDCSLVCPVWTRKQELVGRKGRLGVTGLGL